MVSSVLLAVGIGVLIFVYVGVCLELGFRLGRRFRRERETHPHLGSIQGALLGLLGLLLGFAFQGASQRFIERQDIIVREANAIGTVYLRADLLEAPLRDELRACLRAYTRARLELFRAPDLAAEEAIEPTLVALQNDAWKITMAGVEGRPAALMAMVPAVNEIIDLLSVRNAATHRHLPLPVTALLVACAGISMGVLGLGFGMANNRQVVTSTGLGVLVAAALWLTIDLDYPRRGLVLMSDAPLRDVLREIERGAVSPETPPAR